MSKAVKLDRNGVPINPNDWDYEDWKILWMGMEAVRKAIAARHAEKANAGRCDEECPGRHGCERINDAEAEWREWEDEIADQEFRLRARRDAGEFWP